MTTVRTEVENTMKQKPPVTIVYDLIPTMRIKLSDGIVVTLAELERMVESGMRCLRMRRGRRRKTREAQE
jgi:hypothetical protein